MAFYIIRKNIAEMETDVIVNATNQALSPGGVSRAIFKAAGEERMGQACRQLAPIERGTAVMTPGFALSAKAVIHTAGPRCRDGKSGEEEILAACYRESLALAAENGFKSIAVPLISAGSCGFPEKAALRVAKKTILDFLGTQEMDVVLCLAPDAARDEGEGLEDFLLRHFEVEFSADMQEIVKPAVVPKIAQRRQASGAKSQLSRKKAAQKKSLPHEKEASIQRRSKRVAEEIERTINELHDESIDRNLLGKGEPLSFPDLIERIRAAVQEAILREVNEEFEECEGERQAFSECPQNEVAMKLAEALSRMDAPFSEILMHTIDAKGLRDPDVYNAAYIDRRHFAKMKKTDYRPKKGTALALALSLRLTVPEAKAFLEAAGYALSHSDKRDLIVEYFLQTRRYDVAIVNAYLADYDQPLLGYSVRE